MIFWFLRGGPLQRPAFGFPKNFFLYQCQVVRIEAIFKYFPIKFLFFFFQNLLILAGVKPWSQINEVRNSKSQIRPYSDWYFPEWNCILQTKRGCNSRLSRSRGTFVKPTRSDGHDAAVIYFSEIIKFKYEGTTLARWYWQRCRQRSNKNLEFVWISRKLSISTGIFTYFSELPKSVGGFDWQIWKP